MKACLALALLLGSPAFLGCTAPNPFFERRASEPSAPPTRRPDAGGGDRPASAAETGPPDAPAVRDGLDDAQDASFTPGSIVPTADAGEDEAGADGGDAATEVSPAAITPVAHWRLDETMGQQVADASGNGNVGVLTRGATWASDVLPAARFEDPSALKLDGLLGSVAITAKSLPALAAAKSITAWFWTDGQVTIGRRNIVALNNRAASASIQLGIDFGRVAVWRWSDGGLVVNRSDATSAGWHHVAYVYDGTEHRLYFDGTLVDTSKVASLSAPVTSARLGSFDGVIEMFQGRLDDVRIYGQAISPTAVRALAAGAADF